MNTSTAQVVTLTKRSLQLLLILGTVFLLVKVVLDLGPIQPANASVQDRKLKKKEFVDMPVRIREVKNLQSKTWVNDLEIEVQNVSSKPIYYITLHWNFQTIPPRTEYLEFSWNMERMGILTYDGLPKRKMNTLIRGKRSPLLFPRRTAKGF